MQERTLPSTFVVLLPASLTISLTHCFNPTSATPITVPTTCCNTTKHHSLSRLLRHSWFYPHRYRKLKKHLESHRLIPSARVLFPNQARSSRPSRPNSTNIPQKTHAPTHPRTPPFPYSTFSLLPAPDRGPTCRSTQTGNHQHTQKHPPNHTTHAHSSTLLPLPFLSCICTLLFPASAAALPFPPCIITFPDVRR